MNRSCNILIIEDEYLNAKLIEQSVKALGHNVVAIVSTAIDAYEVIKHKHIDLAFMDINLESNIDGISCAKELNRYYDIPIIYATAYSNSSMIKEAGETNIYGYLIKPFDDRDIEATLNVAIRTMEASNTHSKQNIKNIGNNYSYSFDTKLFTIDNQVIPLTTKETKLLEYFIQNYNHILSYDIFRQNVWEDKIVADSTIRDTILRLRKKAPLLNIDNVIGLGYILKKD